MQKRMQLTGMFGRQRTLGAIVGLTAAYVLALAVWSYEPEMGVGSVLIGEGLFGVPMIIACGLSLWLDSVGARRTLLTFVIFYVLFSFATYYSVFTGEEDAQYQLLLLQVPVIGFPLLVVAGVAAGSFGRASRR
jgi:hypothetical protein